MSDPRRHPNREGRPTRADYERGLPDHHDPTAGIGGARPAQSALTLRLVLATFGLVVSTAIGVIMFVEGAPVGWPIAFFVLAALALVNVAVVARRKLRGEPG